MSTFVHVVVIILAAYGAFCMTVMLAFIAFAWLHSRRKRRDPYTAWLEDALGAGAVKQSQSPSSQIRAARRELKTITTAMFTTKEHSSDDC